MPRVQDDPINELTLVYFYLSMALLQIMNFVVTLSSKVALDFAGRWNHSGIPPGHHVIVCTDWSFNFLKLYLHSRSGSLWKNSCCLEGNLLITHVTPIVKSGPWIPLMRPTFRRPLVTRGSATLSSGGIPRNVWPGVKFLSFDQFLIPHSKF